MTEPAVRLLDVGAAYHGVPALSGVTGSIAAGEALALIGPNGGGKSTLLKALAGLVAITNGEARVLGRAPGDAAAELGYVPQADTLDPDFPISAQQVVLMGRYRAVGWLRWPGPADRGIAADALAEVGLGEQARRPFGSLSGGQRQRVLLARSLAGRPRLLLLDEPFNGVDAVSRRAIVAALRRHRDAGVSVVLSTHDLSIVADLAVDQVCLLHRRQIAFGAAATVLVPDLLRVAYRGPDPAPVT